MSRGCRRLLPICIFQRQAETSDTGAPILAYMVTAAVSEGASVQHPLLCEQARLQETNDIGTSEESID
ncbi:hypothetical protein F441_07380 [Phytophthora nicotianae CJ01A1]|uniref:Uncharacterized protein n=2 Tax=Phytophthora nicotianae TaxID=4792 RepID=W2H214_PHYNI|nr:hypothetical protein L915_07227 [Phytophthora nicotianae]ETL41929.1 hypothetical protein L916_07180 [Phytophthora nicotianae]ETL95079.1 hypothetical protein L917_07072 [Phytophthora nicotianae]ETP18394.1 hypothetical protein F441_07380 [Phytophthora nicotianae CJ01A1]